MVVAIGLALKDQASVFAKTDPDVPDIPQLQNGPQPVRSNRAAFSVQVRDLVSPYNLVSIPVLPGEQVPFGIGFSTYDEAHSFRVTLSGGRIRGDESQTRWTWTAPADPGISTVVIRQEPLGEEVKLHFLVMVPYSLMKRTRLNGYAIGNYPARPLGNNPIYSRPKGFVEVTPQNENILVSPNFQLKQFLCKQESDYPKYLVLNERLVLKLELVLEELNRRGYAADGFHVMSGYRTPAYNKGLKNVKFSMHQFGCAADIFVDQNPVDGKMDDLNQDGQINQRDAAVLTSVIEDMDHSEEYRDFTGGLGRYEKAKAHGPFVHVDVRGWDARWGVGALPRSERIVQRVSTVSMSK